MALAAQVRVDAVARGDRAEAVAAAAIAMGAEGFKTGFVPPSSDVIWASKLIDHGKEQVIEFTAPSKPGEYPYVCTFPGHAMMMRGVMKVTPKAEKKK